MPNNETKQVDEIIASRRAMLMGGTAALAAIALAPTQAKAAATVNSYTDADILNFALNLEYLEANFYYVAAFGCTIDAPNAAAKAAGAPAAGIGIGAGAVTAGTQATFTGGGRVPFASVAAASYAVETAIEEGKHVILLRTALGASAVAQPAIDVSPAAFTKAANAAGISGTFSPYTSDATFLIGAYVFEDVGVTAYHGAAPLITTNSNLSAAASILAVEAYHAGLIRTTINAVDPLNTAGFLTITNQISALRSQLSLAANGGLNSNKTATPDDFGLLGLSGGTNMVALENGATVTATQLVDADANVIAFSRTTTQVLNIVTGGGATTAGTTATGVFFPSGLNGTFK